MSDKIAALKAQVALLELEEEFKEKKASGDLSNEDKLALREARREYRRSHRRPTKDGAQPAGIGGSVVVEVAE